jgi:hypothetical protein
MPQLLWLSTPPSHHSEIYLLTMPLFSNSETYFIGTPLFSHVETYFFLTCKGVPAMLKLTFWPCPLLAMLHDIEFLTTPLFRHAETYFFDHTSFYHAESYFIDHAPYLPPNPVATSFQTIQILFIKVVSCFSKMIFKTIIPNNDIYRVSLKSLPVFERSDNNNA